MIDKQLEVSQGKAVEAFDPEKFNIPGMENVTPGELRIPVLKLVQAQSKMDGAGDNVGKWHNSVTGEFSAAPEFLVIGVAKGRVMFPAQFSADNKPMCGSDNGNTPREEYQGLEFEQVKKNLETGKSEIVSISIPPKCAECHFGKWGENGEPPECSLVDTFAFVGEDGLPGIFQLSRTGMKAAAALKTLVAANGIRKAVIAHSVKEANDTGVYFVPVFTPGGKPGKEWQQTAMRLASLGNLAQRNQALAMQQEPPLSQPEPEGNREMTAEDFEKTAGDIPF